METDSATTSTTRRPISSWTSNTLSRSKSCFSDSVTLCVVASNSCIETRQCAPEPLDRSLQRVADAQVATDLGGLGFGRRISGSPMSGRRRRPASCRDRDERSANPSDSALVSSTSLRNTNGSTATDVSSCGVGSARRRRFRGCHVASASSTASAWDTAPRGACAAASPRWRRDLCRRAVASIARRIVVEDCVHRFHRRGARPRMPSSQHFMKDDSEREQVAPRIDVVPLDLFRRHVGQCSDDLPGPTDVHSRPAGD